MSWAAPAYFWLLLLAIPAGALLGRAALRQHRDLRELAGNGAITPALHALSRLLPCFAFLLVVAALCRPQWGLVTIEQQSKGLDILIALDVSRSMLADDMQPNRLVAAKAAVNSLLPRLQGDRIGLIAFAGSAFQVCPLTQDYSTFAAVLAEAGPDTIPLGGTAVAGALVEAKRVFGEHGGQERVLIVISDGEDHGSGIATAAENLRRAGVAIYSVSTGSAVGGLIPLPGGEFLKNREGAPVRSRLQAAPLETLAVAGGGRRLDLAANHKVLDTLYSNELAARQKQAIRATRQQLAERFQIPLGLALCLLLIEPLFGGRKP